jgi:hypothetical protein
MKEPTPEMTAALQAFADKYGRRWKTELITRWMNGRDDYEPMGSYLRQVRNQFGPTWLMDKCNHIKPAKKTKR